MLDQGNGVEFLEPPLPWLQQKLCPVNCGPFVLEILAQLKDVGPLLSRGMVKIDHSI